jgi:hypothetical protein
LQLCFGPVHKGLPEALNEQCFIHNVSLHN